MRAGRGVRVEHVVGMRIAPVHAAGWSGLRLGGSVGGAFAAKTIKPAVILCIVGEVLASLI